MLNVLVTVSCVVGVIKAAVSTPLLAIVVGAAAAGGRSANAGGGAGGGGGVAQLTFIIYLFIYVVVNLCAAESVLSFLLQLALQLL